MAETQYAYDDELLLLLGRLVVQWSRVEITLAEMLVDLADVPRRTGHMLTAGMSASRLIERCRRLAADVLDGDQLSEIIAWLDRVVAVAIQRNDVVHGGWVSQRVAGEWQPARVSWDKNTGARQAKITTIEDVRHTLTAITDLLRTEPRYSFPSARP